MLGNKLGGFGMIKEDHYEIPMHIPIHLVGVAHLSVSERRIHLENKRDM